MNVKKIAILASALLVTVALGSGGLFILRKRQIGVHTANVTVPEEAKIIWTGSKTVAVVNNTELHEADLAALAPASHDEALGLLVDFTLLDQAAARSHVKVTESELNEERRQLVANTRANSYADAAIKTGRTKKGMDLQLRHTLILRKLAGQMVIGKRSGMFHARGILIKYGGPHGKTRDQALPYAKKLQNQIDHGADIAKLAALNSDDNLSGPNGGDLGVISSFGAPNLVHQTLDFNMQLALSHQLGRAKAGYTFRGPIPGQVGYWVLKIVSTQADPRGDQELYNHVLSLYRSHWTMKYEPLVMMRLRSSAQINPPLFQSDVTPNTNRVR
jgi:hypothetical protein